MNHSKEGFCTPGGLVFVREGQEVVLYRDCGELREELGRWDRDTWVSAALHTWTGEDYRLFRGHWRAVWGGEP